MTELEKQLLSALEQLQQDYSKRLDEWENAFAEWRTMFGLMQRENAALSEARHGLEQAGAEFERAAAPVVTRLNVIEAHREQERAAQHQKALELERSQRQRTYNGPSL